MTTRNGWGAAALATVGMVVMACGSGSGADKPAAGASAAGGKAAAGDKIVIALIAKSSTNAVFLAARTGAEAAAKELSKTSNVPVEIMWLTPPQEDG